MCHRSESRAKRAKEYLSEPEEVFDVESLASAYANSSVATSFPCVIEIEDEFDSILDCLPLDIADLIDLHIPNAQSCLVDVVMDLHRPLLFIQNQGHSLEFDHRIIQEHDISHVLGNVGSITDANRACVGESSLHRCSVMYFWKTKVCCL